MIFMLLFFIHCSASSRVPGLVVPLTLSVAMFVVSSAVVSFVVGSWAVAFLPLFFFFSVLLSAFLSLCVLLAILLLLILACVLSSTLGCFSVLATCWGAVTADHCGQLPL